MALALGSDAVAGIVAGAVVAALGYVGKETVQTVRDWRSERKQRLVRLYQLQALLEASHTAFKVQRTQAGRLEQRLRTRHRTQLPADSGFERVFTHLYAEFDSVESELHNVIRAYTEHALRPLNQAMLTWLRDDVDHRAAGRKPGSEAELAKQLNRLDSHLRLWLAKYETWIPNQPNHALVYLADEEGHGVGFPTGIEDTLAKVLSKRRD
jgi:hypothetical protein